jgi:hypothetical protein
LALLVSGMALVLLGSYAQIEDGLALLLLFAGIALIVAAALSCALPRRLK